MCVELPSWFHVFFFFRVSKTGYTLTLSRMFFFKCRANAAYNLTLLFYSNHALEYPIDCDGRKPISGVIKTRGLTRNSWKVPRSPLKRAHKLTTRNHFKLVENCCKCKKQAKKKYMSSQFGTEHVKYVFYWEVL